jgi:hypothetical protein
VFYGTDFYLEGDYGKYFSNWFSELFQIRSVLRMNNKRNMVF